MIYSFDNDTRLIEMKINIYFDDVILSVTKDDYLISCSLLEELSSDDTSPLGAVSSNEFEFELYNENDIFTPTNEQSKYYGKIKSNVKVDVFIREELSNGKWISMGTYYISDWKCYQSSQTIIATCNDKIQSIINKNIPSISIERNVSVKDFITLILKSVGLTSSEFKIDNLLSLQTITYAYPHSNKLGEVLNELSKAHLCYIYMNRDNVLEVVSMLNSNRVSVGIWSDDNQIIEPNIESSIIRKYTSVIVKYVNKYISGVVDIASIDKLTIPPGNLKLDTIITNEPIYEVNGVVCEATRPITVKSISQSANELYISLNNDNTDILENVTITLSGKTIKTNSTLSIEKSISDIDNTRPLELTSEYIDNKNIAEQISNIMYNYITEDVPFIEILIRGNPEITLGSIITIDDTTNKISGDYIIVSQKFTFNDSLECNVRCLNKSILKGVESFNVSS